MTRVPWGRETMAGLAGAIGSVPDGMATAVLAGANPMAGLYASFAGPTAGGLMQSTTVMVVATTSAAAVTTAEVMNAGPEDPIRTLATLTLLAGVFMLLATRLGFARLMRFVSASVMGGFMFGVGLILILGQLADATGVTTSGGSTLEKALNTLRQWQSIDRASVLTAVTAIVQAQMSPFRASLIIGILWGAWHLPVLVTRDPASIVLFLVLALGLSFVFTLMFNSSGGSLIPGLLFHATVNWEEGFEALMPGLTGTDWETWSTLALLLIGLVAAVQVARRPLSGQTHLVVRRA